MRKLTQREFDRALRRPWPRLMDAEDISELTGWTSLSILSWIRDGTLTGARTMVQDKNVVIVIPRELVLAQLDPRPHTLPDGETRD